jgi:subtilisin family serine protease
MKKLTLAFLTLFLVASCGPKSNNKGPLEIIKGYIFSTRQQSTTTYVSIIQLKSPSLLKDAKVVDGKAIIDEELKKTINDEQEEVIAKLQEISAEIKILARYKLVLNAIAFSAPSNFSDKIEKVPGVSRVLENTNFERPKTMSTEKKIESLVNDLNTKNSVTFITADKLHKLGFDGKGMKIGIIDTGIDYTHKMLGGPGTKEAYGSINPNEKTDLFPNEKVVGGVDFVGTEFNAASSEVEKQIPHRDENPLDEAEHGTHVSGTVAGIGDGTNTYSGVAPLAKLYGLKVFGKTGSTSDIAVIQALEYAADISESQNPDNHLDVVNLSLGGGFGKPKILYSEAISNLTKAGTVVVASAGNSGDNPYITGAPATSDEAISIAASIDDMDQNIVNSGLEIKFTDSKKVVEIIEGNFTKPSHTSNVTGELVYLGNGADPISDEVKAKVKGKVALIDRGAINFVNKVALAVELEAIGVVVANNQDGDPIQMGGDKNFDIPAVMITKTLGTEIKAALSLSPVSVNFSSEVQIFHREKIDQITDFSSRGPRSLDSLIKPEIAAPGANIISAKCGSGTEGVQFSGTSMASPHMTGVMALLKQAFPKLSVAELKAKVMNTSKILMSGEHHVPVALQGAGRVQVFEAFKSKVIALPASLSLGEIALSSVKAVSMKVHLKNISDEDVVLTTKTIKGKNVSIDLPASVKVKAKSESIINVSFKFNRNAADENNIETDGFVILTSSDGSTIQLPFLAVLNKVTDIKASDLITQTDSKVDRFGAEVKLKLENNGKNTGDVLLFNLLGTDDKKVADEKNLSSNTSCDLESAGIRIIERTTEGKKIKLLQIGVKLYDTLTMWQPCDVSLQIDNNGDGVADLELVGTKSDYVPGIQIGESMSLLLDAQMARDIRKAFETDPKTATENYVPAVLDAQAMKFYDHGSIAVIETDLSKITLGKAGLVGIKVAVSHLESEAFKSDDYLASHEEKWQKINLNENSFAFTNIPEVISLKPSDVEYVSMKRGLGEQRLLALYPSNMPIGSLTHDKESQILTEKLLK